MQIASLCRGSVVVVNRETSVRESAELMRRYHIGAVVVVESEMRVRSLSEL
jgi:CBS domain-containing protein